MKKPSNTVINDIIDANASKFVNGKALSFTAFKGLFRGIPGSSRITNKTPQGCMEVFSLYAAFNVILAERGIAMESSGYYKQFAMKATPKDKVDALTGRSTRATARAKRLSTGIKTYSSAWSKLTQTELDDL